MHQMACPPSSSMQHSMKFVDSEIELIITNASAIALIFSSCTIVFMSASDGSIQTSE